MLRIASQRHTLDAGAQRDADRARQARPAHCEASQHRPLRASVASRRLALGRQSGVCGEHARRDVVRPRGHQIGSGLDEPGGRLGRHVRPFATRPGLLRRSRSSPAQEPDRLRDRASTRTTGRANACDSRAMSLSLHGMRLLRSVCLTGPRCVPTTRVLRRDRAAHARSMYRALQPFPAVLALRLHLRWARAPLERPKVAADRFGALEHRNGRRCRKRDANRTSDMLMPLSLHVSTKPSCASPPTC